MMEGRVTPHHELLGTTTDELTRLRRANAELQGMVTTLANQNTTLSSDLNEARRRVAVLEVTTRTLAAMIAEEEQCKAALLWGIAMGNVDMGGA